MFCHFEKSKNQLFTSILQNTSFEKLFSRKLLVYAACLLERLRIINLKSTTTKRSYDYSNVIHPFHAYVSIFSMLSTISKYCRILNSTGINTARKVSKYGVFSGPYFPVFGPEKTPYLDTFHEVKWVHLHYVA